MWHVNKLIATDGNGNYVDLDDDKCVLCASTASGRVYRNVEFKTQPPCLSVAVNDLLNEIESDLKDSRT